MLDERWIRSLHVESMRHADLHEEREPHVLFQASTIGALLDGAFEGDVSFAELAEHGDLGLGTLNHLDGEMVAIDGGFFRADVGGQVTPVGPEERTPFAVVTVFEPTVDERLPDAEGIEVAGYHLHFIRADRTRGGHVLDSRSRGLRVRLDPSNDLHVELPPQIDLTDPALAAQTHAAVELVERAG
jgi:alpha-acetolactate decarboxylase